MRNKRHFPTTWHKADFIENKLRDLSVRRSYIIEKVYIEQSLQAFRPGFSSAKTILTLAKFNGIVSYLVRRVFEIVACFTMPIVSLGQAFAIVWPNAISGPKRFLRGLRGCHFPFSNISTLSLPRCISSGSSALTPAPAILDCPDRIKSFIFFPLAGPYCVFSSMGTGL